jgi:hypothetical protein
VTAPRRGDWSRDPGWRDAIRGSWWFLIPGGVQLRVKRQQRDGGDGLLLTRSVFLAFVTAILAFAIVLTILDPPSQDPDASPWVAAGLVVVGLIAIFQVTPRVTRPLDCASDSALASTYRTRFFLRIAISESIALIGFVATFVVGPAWIYYVGGAVTLLGFGVYAPSVANLAGDQRELAARGCERSLVAALRRPAADPSPS